MIGADTLRIGIIGLGVGEKHIAGYEQDPRCEVVAICDIDEGRLEEVARRHPGPERTTNPDDVLGDPDIQVVSIASYDDAHFGQVASAIQDGKHVFVEKPLCMLPEELREIRRLLEDNPRVRLSSNLILRKCPRFSRLRERLSEGELGRIYYLEADYNYGRLHKIVDGWRGALPFYSVVHGGAIHMIDLIMWMTGDRPTEVTAYGTRLATDDTSFRYDDTVVAILRFTSGAIGKISANFPCVIPHHHQLAVYGTEGSFLHGIGGATMFRSRNPDASPQPIDDPYPGTEKGDMIPSFVSSLLDAGEAEATADSILDGMAVSLAVEQSAKSGGPVSVDYGQPLGR